MLAMFYQLSDEEFRQALRGLIPKIRQEAPTKYAIFIEEFLADMRVK